MDEEYLTRRKVLQAGIAATAGLAYVAKSQAGESERRQEPIEDNALTENPNPHYGAGELELLFKMHTVIRRGRY